MQSNIPVLWNHDPSKSIGHATLYDGEFLELILNAISNDTPDFVLCWGVKTNHTSNTKVISYLGFNTVPAYQTILDDTPHWNIISEVGLPTQEFDWVLVKTDFLDGEAVPYIAELRNGVWWAHGISDGPLEEVLGVKVIAWFDMQSIIL